MTVVNSKKIAKNTLLLYIRMLLLMVVSLYTSRVILKYLGVNDYGIYTLIGGFITVFSIVTNSLVVAVQRYFNVSLGQKDELQYSRIYSMSINIFILFAAIILIIGETVGLWFVAYKLNIPAGRESAVLWVYQISLLTTIVGLFRIPDNASIIAFERMDFYAYISIGEAFLKLAIVFLLSLSPVDRLITYVLLYLMTTIIINLVYKLYCIQQFAACHFHYCWDKKLFKELLSFSGWSLLSRFTIVGKTQGENFFLNHYHTVAVNAARGVAMQVYNAVNLFLVNFQTAFKPQLVKSYASGEMEDHYRLIKRSAKFSYYLLLLIVLPVAFNMDALLNVWLVEVPPYTKEFCVFILLAYLVDAIGAPLEISVFANGDIKGLQIFSALSFFVAIVISFVLLSIGMVPYIVSIVTLIVHVMTFVITLFYAHKLSKVNVAGFIKSVFLPIMVVSSIAVVLPIFLNAYTAGFWRAVLFCAVEFFWSAAAVWLVGLEKVEKKYVRNIIKSKLHRV